MTTDSTQPQTELGPAAANGQGQSQGHRRRRRRRKNKSSQQGAQQAAGQVPGTQTQAQTPQPPPVAQAAPPPKAHQQNQNNGGGQGQGQGRKKKKFFQKGSSGSQQSNTTTHQPGNTQNGFQGNGSGGKRKMKQRGPREFVGPMDHSYRVVNGNVADGPPSTIQLSNGHGGGHGSQGGHNGFYQDNYALRAVVKDDSPTRIFCFIDDLFFQAKINETSKKLGVKVEFVKGDKESVTRLTDVAEADRPTLVVLDLNNLNAKPLTLIPKIKAKLKKATSIIGFLNHLQGDLKLKAIEAGCDTVMPRSAFSQSLPNLLRRYGLEEEEDNYPQPV
jgi:hypothetical protein